MRHNSGPAEQKGPFAAARRKGSGVGGETEARVRVRVSAGGRAGREAGSSGKRFCWGQGRVEREPIVWQEIESALKSQGRNLPRRRPVTRDNCA